MNLTVASSPHIRGDFRTSRMMLDVALALLPALLVGAFVLGICALLVALVCIAASVGAEWAYCHLTKGRNTVLDCSAIVTGLLLAMTLPVDVPLWLAALGSIFAIVMVKALCGGLGQNIFNPALSARAIMLLIYPMAMTHYVGIDGVSSATPLHQMAMHSLPQQGLWDMFLGNCPGSIGEISALALLAGGAYLVIRKVISLRIPVSYLATVALLALLFPKAGNPLQWSLYNLLSGGILLGAIFMATDYATSPATALGQIVYGIGCGVLTFLFRNYGLYPEGVTYAILIMNAFVWIIDRYTAPTQFGVKKGGIWK